MIKAGPLGRVAALLVVVCGCLVAFGTAPAHAEDEAAGRKHFKQGQELYTQGKFLEAAKEFEAGYQAAPRPLFLLNIGHSYRRAQELRKAKDAYETLLKVDPTTPHRPEVQELIQTIDDALNAPSTVSDPSRTSPPASPIPTTAAPPLPSVAAPAIVGPPVAFDATPPPAPPAESGSLWKSPWLWSAIGVVVVAGVVGTVYGLSRGPSCQVSACYTEGSVVH